MDKKEYKSKAKKSGHKIAKKYEKTLSGNGVEVKVKVQVGRKRSECNKDV